MTLEELTAMWNEDGEINETDLSGETRKIPKLHNKYFTLYIKTGLRVKKLRSELVTLEKDKSEYYSGSMDQEELKERGWKPFPLKVIKQNLPKYIESDKDIITLSLKIDYHHSLEMFLQDIVKQINNRNFLIKNIIEWNKFQSGTM